ncbi:Phosphate-specific transport system accessory protein PhoU homolog [Candidatus Hydrogenisulfobacillus filiaventi]|uniref:Phosphate-specific transport system accessory protein PhoU n=1 Tax=Candidatus Hydrogenisulfobacillus filiaventi TaxID=2707344 RepID=A0A6F8ZJU7_9FIRM|nr:phosphate signaling complex protein PhoU [Bacillota bacterium]CAB1129723.1 Phosphate-specific transport system accessory protein PhoU homolog [Candidatus Hydrogenisulfobacillus filiaventi]
MGDFLHGELRDLEQELLRMGALVEDQIRRAVQALVIRDAALAREVMDDDDRVDRMEMAIERRCLKLLALQQPLAGDLRVVSTILKIITDLERMADHASDLARAALRMGPDPLPPALMDHIPRMGRLAGSMVRSALNAYIHRDVAEALTMIRLDDDVDHLYAEVFREGLEFMKEHPEAVDQGTYLLFAANYLERVADHATNLGEWVIFMVTGERQELNH